METAERMNRGSVPGNDILYVRAREEPVLPPPSSQVGAAAWLRGNLFSSIPNAILTLLALALIVWIVPPLIRWAFVDAVWTGADREACAASPDGACWAFVRARFGQFIYGRYPLEERWRINLTAVLFLIGLVPMAIPKVPYKRETAIFLLGAFPIIAVILLTGGNFAVPLWLYAAVALAGCLATGFVAMGAADAAPLAAGRVAPAAIAVVIAALVIGLALHLSPGLSAIRTGALAVAVAGSLAALAAGLFTAARDRSSNLRGTVLTIWLGVVAMVIVLALFAADFGLPAVETSLWGGLTVTLVVAVVGIAASLPLGILLALGRRSELPVIRLASTTFIEFVRGVPLITVLFMASVMLPLFLPPGVNFDKLLRALIGVALFSAAYMAEVVRAGLQAIPRGQFEGAKAMGLNYAQMMRLIILPQALKIVIPGIVNSFISLFKDTTLVLIIGIFDLLGIVQLGFSDANWAAPSTPATGYVFAALVFWIFCFSMSRYSIFMERRLNTGRKR